MRKSQSALEFMIISAFMLFVILGFFAITTSRILDAKEESNRQTAEDIAEFASKEAEIAKSVNDGYTRTFYLPQTVSGANYTITLIDNKELVVSYLGYEHVKFINATGSINRGLNKVSNKKGVVYIN